MGNQAGGRRPSSRGRSTPPARYLPGAPRADRDDHALSELPLQSSLADPLHDWRVCGGDQPSLSDSVPTNALPFVGREELLLQFDRLANHARHAANVVLALSGEAGIGKSRLLREF